MVMVRPDMMVVAPTMVMVRTVMMVVMVELREVEQPRLGRQCRA
jgi:hypothetical protein